MKHQGPISDIAAHRNFVATAGYDNQLILWEKLSGHAVARGFHDHLVNRVCFSPNASLLASASSDYSVRLWDIPSMKLRTVIGYHMDDVEMVSFSPNGKYLATCSRDHLVRVLDLQGKLISEMLGHTDDVVSVTWSNDGRHVFSSGDDGTVRFWDSWNGKNIQTYVFDGVQTDTVIVSSLGQIFIGDDNGQIIVVNDGLQVKNKAHKAGIKRIILNSENNLIVSLSYDRTMAIWRLNNDLTITEINRTEFPAIVWPRSGVFLDCNRIATGTFGSRYAIYDRNQNLWMLNQIESYNSFNAVCSKDDDIYAIGDSGVLYKNNLPISELGSLCNFIIQSRHRIITGGQCGIVFDAITGEELYKHHSPINCGVTFKRGSNDFAAFGTYTGEIVVIDLSIQPATVIGVFEAHDNAIKGIAANDSYLFSVSASTEVVYTDITSMTTVRRIENAHNKIANGCIAINKGFASISRDLCLRLWTSDNVAIIESPHQNSIKCLCADSSGDIIATGSYSGVIFMFDIKKSKWVHGIRPTSAGISSITFSKKNNEFIASSYDGNLYSVSISSIHHGFGSACLFGDKYSSVFD